jgi:cell division protein FtsW
MDPWTDPFGGGYQLTLSLMAIGRGEWFGVGLGEGLMKLGYLPDAHTDFIFSVIVEEMGLFTAILIISSLFFISFRSFYIGRKALERNLYFGFFIAYGVAILVGLPFLSYGGTNLLIMCCLCALVLRVDQETKSAMPSINISRRVSF